MTTRIPSRRDRLDMIGDGVRAMLAEEVRTVTAHVRGGSAPSNKLVTIAKLAPNFGCASEHVYKLAVMLSGGSVEEAETPIMDPDGLLFSPGACLVPIDAANGHSYPLGEAVVVIDPVAGRCMTRGGGIGNNLRNRGKVLARAATVAEVDAYVAALPSRCTIDLLSKLNGQS